MKTAQPSGPDTCGDCTSDNVADVAATWPLTEEQLELWVWATSGPGYVCNRVNLTFDRRSAAARWVNGNTGFGAHVYRCGKDERGLRLDVVVVSAGPGACTCIAHDCSEEEAEEWVNLVCRLGA